MIVFLAEVVVGGTVVVDVVGVVGVTPLSNVLASTRIRELLAGTETVEPLTVPKFFRPALLPLATVTQDDGSVVPACSLTVEC